MSRAEAHETITLPEVARKAMAYHFGEDDVPNQSLTDLIESLAVPAQYRQPAGVFVTLSHKGKSRACWGTLQPDSPDLVQATVHATLNALTREYRYPPVKRGEWKTLKPQVTVIRRLDAIDNLAGQNPLRDGLFVRSGGKTAVLLPGEAKDAHYQLVQCKLKAGIKPGEPFQLYRVKADVYK